MSIIRVYTKTKTVVPTVSRPSHRQTDFCSWFVSFPRTSFVDEPAECPSDLCGWKVEHLVSASRPTYSLQTNLRVTWSCQHRHCWKVWEPVRCRRVGCWCEMPRYRALRHVSKNAMVGDFCFSFRGTVFIYLSQIESMRRVSETLFFANILFLLLLAAEVFLPCTASRQQKCYGRWFLFLFSRDRFHLFFANRKYERVSETLFFANILFCCC